MKFFGLLALLALLNASSFAQQKSSHIQRSYDKFKNLSAVESKQLSLLKKDGMQISYVLVCAHDGATKITPSTVVVLFIVESIVRYDAPGDLDILRDGVSNKMGKLEVYSTKENLFTWTKVFRMPLDYAGFVKLANSKTVEMRLDKTEFSLSDADIRLLREFVKEITL
jgi:hypothetical protein